MRRTGALAAMLVVPVTALAQAPEPLVVPGRAPSWHPDGDRIAFERRFEGSWSVAEVEVGTGVVRELGSTESGYRWPAWSPDGNRVAVVVPGAVSRLVVLSREGVSLADYPLESGASAPSWHPDGGRIAYSVESDAGIGIQVHDLSTGASSSPLSPIGRDLWPRWHPSGDHLAFFSRRDTGGDDDEIYVLSVDTGELRRVTERAGHDFAPAWSPAGTALAFVSLDSDGDRRIRVVDAQSGAEFGAVGEGFHRVTEPAWAPDGRAIAFAAVRVEGGEYELFVQRLPFAP